MLDLSEMCTNSLNYNENRQTDASVVEFAVGANNTTCVSSIADCMYYEELRMKYFQRKFLTIPNRIFVNFHV
jgi:hypothetical protein